jgi:hypothetical protein
MEGLAALHALERSVKKSNLQSQSTTNTTDQKKP